MPSAVSLMNESQTITYTNVVVGGTSTLLSAANSARVAWAIINRSDERVDFKIGAAAVSAEGIPLAPASAAAFPGEWEMSRMVSFFSTAAIYGICASGSKTVTVAEATS